MAPLFFLTCNHDVKNGKFVYNIMHEHNEFWGRVSLHELQDCSCSFSFLFQVQ